MVKKKGNISADALAIMENVAFSSSFEILTWDVFCDTVALFLAGSSLPSRHSGRRERWELARRVRDEISVSKCAIFSNSGWAWWPSLSQKRILLPLLSSFWLLCLEIPTTCCLWKGTRKCLLYP